MGVNHYWLVDQHVLYAYYWDQIGIEDLKAASEYAIEQLRGSDRPLVHIVVDMRDLKNYPKNVFEISNATAIFREKNLGWVVLLTHDRVISFLGATVTQIASKVRFRSFQQPEDGFKFLHKVDASLPDTLAHVSLKQTNPVQIFAQR